MAQTDTFDPKRRGDPQAKKAGSYYDAIDTAVPGVRLCEHLHKLAPLMERCRKGERIAEVRQMYIDTLDNWPTESSHG